MKSQIFLHILIVTIINEWGKVKKVVLKFNCYYDLFLKSMLGQPFFRYRSQKSLNEQTKIEHNFRECMCVFMKNCNEFAHENFLEVLFISVEICTFKKSQDNSCCITVYNMRAEIWCLMNKICHQKLKLHLTLNTRLKTPFLNEL